MILDEWGSFMFSFFDIPCLHTIPGSALWKQLVMKRKAYFTELLMLHILKMKCPIFPACFLELV